MFVICLFICKITRCFLFFILFPYLEIFIQGNPSYHYLAETNLVCVLFSLSYLVRFNYHFLPSVHFFIVEFEFKNVNCPHFFCVSKIYKSSKFNIYLYSWIINREGVSQLCQSVLIILLIISIFSLYNSVLLNFPLLDIFQQMEKFVMTETKI